jgi:hypothetical protein
MPLPKLPALNIPERVSLPKGSREHREAAVARLAPHQGIWIRDDGTRQKLSLKFAVQCVEGIARMYNTNLYLERHSPRSSAVLKQIDRIKSRTDGLAQELNQLTYLTARIIYGETEARSRKPARAALFEAADIAGIVPSGRTQSAWTRRLSALSKTLQILAQELPQDWERRGLSVQDKGAKRTHFTELEGTAKWRLLTDSFHVYEGFKPGEGTGTEEGDLHHFVNEIFEYATGKEPKDGLLRPLRDLLKPTREQDALNRRNQEILDELEAIAPGKTIDLMSEAELERSNELHKELSRNFKRRAELTRITWRHTPPALIKAFAS